MTDKKWTEVKANFFKPDEIGKSCEGYLVDKKTVDNKMKTPPVKQVVYTLLGEDGSSILVGGRHGNPQILSGLENCKMGQYVKITYTGDNEPKTKGYHATKVLKVETNGVIDAAKVREFKGSDMIEVEQIEM